MSMQMSSTNSQVGRKHARPPKVSMHYILHQSTPPIVDSVTCSHHHPLSDPLKIRQPEFPTVADMAATGNSNHWGVFAQKQNK